MRTPPPRSSRLARRQAARHCRRRLPPAPKTSAVSSSAPPNRSRTSSRARPHSPGPVRGAPATSSSSRRASSFARTRSSGRTSATASTRRRLQGRCCELPIADHARHVAPRPRPSGTGSTGAAPAPARARRRLDHEHPRPRRSGRAVRDPAAARAGRLDRRRAAVVHGPALRPLRARSRDHGERGRRGGAQPFAFNMRWPGMPTPLPTEPGLVRWTPVRARPATRSGTRTSTRSSGTNTNVADEREFYTFTARAGTRRCTGAFAPSVASSATSRTAFRPSRTARGARPTRRRTPP